MGVKVIRTASDVVSSYNQLRS